MTRGSKVKRFLMGGLLTVGGLLSLISGPTTKYIIGGILIFFSLIFLSEKSSRVPGMLCMVLGGLFVAGTYFSADPSLGILSSVLVILGIVSLFTGGYISYDTYKKLNQY